MEATATSIGFCTSSCAGCTPLLVTWLTVQRHVPLCCQAQQQANTTWHRILLSYLAALAHFPALQQASVVVVRLKRHKTHATCLGHIHHPTFLNSHLGSSTGLSPRRFREQALLAFQQLPLAPALAWLFDRLPIRCLQGSQTLGSSQKLWGAETMKPCSGVRLDLRSAALVVAKSTAATL